VDDGSTGISARQRLETASVLHRTLSEICRRLNRTLQDFTPDKGRLSLGQGPVKLRSMSEAGPKRALTILS